MKTPQQAFSGNPFINILRLAVAKVKKKEIFKRAALVLFVLLCVLIKLSMLSAEKNQVKQNRQISFAAGNQNWQVWPAKLMLKNGPNYKHLFIRLDHQTKKAGRN